MLKEYIKDIVDLEPFIGLPPAAGVRFNPLKITREDFLRLFEGRVVPALYMKDGFRITESRTDGNHPLHISGACYFQEPSAMSAVTALNVQNGEKVLDLCSAPGSKATALAANNPDGVIVANEIHPARAKILVSNLERFGIANALVTNSDCETLAKSFGGYFDKILVDSPCSGEGMFRKYPEILENWTEQLVADCAARSRRILEQAARMLRPGGRLVYSTCTFNTEENEKTVLSFLQAHPEFSAVETGLEHCQSGLLGLQAARRIFPSEAGEGHFVCALEKSKQSEHDDIKVKYFTEEKLPPEVAALLEQTVQTPVSFFGAKRGMICSTFGDTVYILPADLPRPEQVRIVRAGVQTAVRKGKTYFPAHHLFTATPPARFLQVLETDDAGAHAFLKGETLPCGQKGFTAVLWHHIALGFGKASGGTLKNHFPKGLRIL